MSKKSPKITQELKWEYEDYENIRVKYRRRSTELVPENPVRTDDKDRNWKKYRQTQWKEKEE